MLLFPDTNFFLQCQFPAELPWGDITADTEIEMFVSRTVQREIDKFKGDGNGRRSKRARTVSSWFAQILKTGQPHVFRERSPRVTLNLPPRIDPKHEYPPGLDTTQNDDRIVGEVLAYGDRDTVLLTGDTNMAVTARDEGLTYIPTPESWRMPPEPDQRDKVLAELRQRITVLESALPEIKVDWNQDEGSSSEMFGVVYEQLPESVIAELLELVQTSCPLQTEFDRESDPGFQIANAAGRASIDYVRLSQVTWKPPSSEAIDVYRAKHAKWLENVEAHLRQVHNLLPGSRCEDDWIGSSATSAAFPPRG